MKAEEENFFELVYEVVRLIPRGRVTSYGAIARYLGTARSSRMVGWALNNCHRHSFPVPAHRVVNRNGLLSGKHHFPREDEMQRLLESEGVSVEDEQVKDFNKIYWDPMRELSL